MPTKPIIDIDIDTSKFERFQKLYDKYQEQLAKSPAAWAKVNKENAAISKHIEKITAALLAQNQVAQETSSANKEQAKYLMRGDTLWTSMAKSTKSVASNIIGATRALLSWTGILGAVGGLIGAGGLFGIDRMAANAANQRRSSMGLGLSIGEQKAFQVNFSRVVDPDQYLGWVNQMETDPTKAWSAYALGVNPTGNTENDSVSLLKALRARAKSTPTNQLGLLQNQFGLSGVSTEDLRRLQKMGDSEFNGLVAGNARDIKSLGISDPVARKWQDFTTQMERAGAQIVKTFVNGLIPLAGPLEHLSGAVVKFIEVLMKSDLVKGAINNLAHWLESFSGEVGGNEFLDKVRQFTSDMGDLADAVHMVAHPIDTIVSPGWKAGKEYFYPSPEGLKANPANFQRYLGRLDSGWGLTPGLVETVKQLENSGDNAVNSKSGAMGMFQFMPDTWAQYGHGSPFDRVNAANAAAKYLSYLQSKYKGDISKELAAYNYGEGNLDKLVGAHGKDWERYAPRETRQYLMNAQPMLQAMQGGGTRVEIYNNTGGNASVVASQLAH